MSGPLASALTACIRESAADTDVADIPTALSRPIGSGITGIIAISGKADPHVAGALRSQRSDKVVTRSGTDPGPSKQSEN